MQFDAIYILNIGGVVTITTSGQGTKDVFHHAIPPKLTL